MTIAVVQKVASVSTGSSTQSVSMTFPTIAGNNLVVGICAGNMGNLTGVTDNLAGSGYAQAVLSNAFTGAQVVLYYLENNVGGITSVTANFSSGTGIGIGAYEISGLLTSSSLGNVNTNSSSPSTTPATATLTPSSANSIVIGMAGVVGGTSWLSIDAPFTQGWLSSDGTRGHASGSDIVSSTSPVTFNANLSAGNSWLSAIAEFKASGGPPPPGPSGNIQTIFMGW